VNPAHDRLTHLDDPEGPLKQRRPAVTQVGIAAALESHHPNNPPDKLHAGSAIAKGVTDEMEVLPS